MEKTWSVFVSHSRNTFCERNVCEKAAFRLNENKTRAVGDPQKRKSKKRKISGS